MYFIFDMIALLVFFVNTELDYKAVFSQDLTISANYGKNKNDIHKLYSDEGPIHVKHERTNSTFFRQGSDCA